MKWAAGGVLFVLLATANAAGYRYGTSDQAFYVPAVVRALNPAAYPRDAGLIDAQARLMVADEIIAALSRATGLSVESIFLGAYLLALALIWAALILIGRSVYGSAWLTLALAAAFTLRHRIPRTSANTFEPYFHPRMFAFALGALAIAALFRRRFVAATGLVAAAALVHVTTALWFAILVGVAIAILDVRWRRLAIAGALGAAGFVAWALAAGPLDASLTRMDDTWMQAMASKDSLLATEWPVWAWLANLALLAILWWSHRTRQTQGTARPEDAALVWGATVLVGVFLVTLPAVAGRTALPVQLQISRVFWLVDFVATVYVLALFRRERAARALAIVLVAVSAIRGVYVMAVEHPERSLFAAGLATSPWEDAMAWLKRQPVDTHVLADPGHGWRYGTSVRVAAERDVLVEEVKDSAIAIYSRDVAIRYLERTAAIGDFGALTAHRALELAAKYELDYLVTEADLPLPVAYSNAQFRVYSLRSP